MKITIIGAGNMGGAIARGLAAGGGSFRPEEITVTARTETTLDKIRQFHPAIHTTTDNAVAVQGADFVVLAVKPWLLPGVLQVIREHLDLARQVIISVAAGISFEELRAMLGGAPALFRVIPNTAIAIGQSVTLIAQENATEEQSAQVQKIFDELGIGILIEERLMGAGTAVTSCGIAYALQYIKAAIQGAIELGLYPQTARKMICQTLRGAADLLEHNDSMPDTEIYKVCTPGGITIKGLNEMAARGFDAAVIEGLKRAAGK
jgi:pyrroline-5-carboxylate reductase